jgi:hypothetical protein
VCWVFGELPLQLWAAVIIISDVGFLTPVSVMTVPDIKLPLKVFETSEMSCAKVNIDIHRGPYQTSTLVGTSTDWRRDTYQ